MKLYTNPFSPNCRKVHALAAYLNLDLDKEIVDLRAGAQLQPEFLAVNPNGKVPALVDGETTLWESNAILAYCASKQDTSSWPKSNDRYEIMKWLFWEASHLGPAVGKLVGQYIFAPMRGAEPDQDKIESALKDFRKYAAVADGQLSLSPYLVGESPTLADFAVAVWLSYTDACKLPVGEFTHLGRWWSDMQALEGGPSLHTPKL